MYDYNILHARQTPYPDISAPTPQFVTPNYEIVVFKRWLLVTARGVEPYLWHDGRWRFSGLSNVRDDWSEEITACREWVRRYLRPRKRGQHCVFTATRSPYDSYGLKHLIEAWWNRYVPNGAAIQALLDEGIPTRRLRSGQNVEFAALPVKPKAYSRIQWRTVERDERGYPVKHYP